MKMLQRDQRAAGANSSASQLPPPPPLESATPLPRRAAPFALAMLAVTKSAPNGGDGDGCTMFAMPNVVLRKVAPQPIFAVRAVYVYWRSYQLGLRYASISGVTDPICPPIQFLQNFDDDAYAIKPPTQMMRFLDALRYHKPTDVERCELNISSSAERLHLHHLNDVRTRASRLLCSASDWTDATDTLCSLATPFLLYLHRS